VGIVENTRKRRKERQGYVDLNVIQKVDNNKCSPTFRTTPTSRAIIVVMITSKSQKKTQRAFDI
jgi:hypothetical protein